MAAFRWGLIGLALGACALFGTGSHAAAQQDCTITASPDNAQSRLNNAPDGAVVCLDAGVYRGPLRIENKRNLTLRGAGQQQTIIAGGTVDSMLIFRSENLTLEDFKLFFGNPSNAYVWGSSNVNFRHVDAGGGSLGIHFDHGSQGRISESFIYAMSGDGVLTRNAADVTVELSWVFLNGGVGVSTVGNGATTAVIHNIISDNGGPGVFVGVTPCALLPPGFVEVPECYLSGLAQYVSDANVVLDGNIVQSSGSTGIVLFPGTNATMRKNRVWRNHLSGLFVWGGNFSSEADEYDGNDEHAIEARAYPDPLKYPEIPSGQRIRAVGRINNNVIRNTVALPENGRLGGGVLGQGANMDVTNSQIYGNRGIGVSYVNTSLGSITGNQIHDNRGSAICLFHAGNVAATANTIYNNDRDAVGVCHETTP